ncbi:hypothetical protein ACFX1X_005662 [Malus domestica]
MKVSGNPTLSSIFRLHTSPSNPPLSHTSSPILILQTHKTPPNHLLYPPPHRRMPETESSTLENTRARCWAPFLKCTLSRCPKISTLATLRIGQSSPTKSLTTPFTGTGAGGECPERKSEENRPSV